jgi:hypothetical protein
VEASNGGSAIGDEGSVPSAVLLLSLQAVISCWTRCWKSSALILPFINSLQSSVVLTGKFDAVGVLAGCRTPSDVTTVLVLFPLASPSSKKNLREPSARHVDSLRRIDGKIRGCWGVGWLLPHA